MAIPVLPWRSIKTRIILSTLVIFLASLWSLSFYASQMLHKDMERLLGEQQQSTVSMVGALVNHEIEERLNTLETVAKLSSSAMHKGPTTIQTLLEQRFDLHALFNGGIFVCGPDGIVISDYPAQGRIGLNLMDRDYIAGALKEGKTTVSKPVISRVSGTPDIVLASPIHNAKGEVIGALAGSINLATRNFMDQITDSHYGKSGGYLLIAPQYRQIVTATDKTRIMEALPTPGINPAFDRVIKGGYAGSVVYVKQNGIEILASAKLVPAADWQMLATLPTFEAFSPIRDMQQRMLLATIFLTLLAVGFTWWILKRQLSPLLTTAKTLATMSEGEQSLQPLPIIRDDEIGQLIAGFNRLLQTLGDRTTALQNALRFQHELMDTVPSPIYFKDIKGVYIGGNRAFVQALNLPAEQFIGKTAYDVTTRDQAEFYEKSDKALLNNPHHIQTLESTFMDSQGAVSNVIFNKATFTNAEGKVAGLIGVILDITERKKIEEKLAQSESQLRTLIHAIPDLIWLKDPHGVYLTCNERFERFFGASEKEIAGKTDYDFVNKELAESFRQHDMAAVAKGTPTVNEEWITFADDGHRELLETTKTPMFDARGQLIGVLGIGHDVTAQKLLEKEFQARRNEMENLVNQQVAAQTAAAIAHELNQPLVAVSAYSEAALSILRGGTKSPEKLTRAIEGAMEQAQRAGRTLHELLDFLHKGEATVEPVDLNGIVVDALSIANESGYGGFHPVLDLEKDLLPVQANPLQLKKVLVNLVHNGVEAMRNAGVPAPSITIKVRTTAEGNMAQVTVQDTGPGLDAETAHRIFDPFFTTKPNGIGLGLAISRALIEANGGRLWVDHDEAPGATFHFVLPFAS